MSGSAWMFVWLMLILKIPILGLLILVRWAVRQEPEPEPAGDADGGIGPVARPSRPSPRHPRPPLPRAPRRGPHCGGPLGAPTPAAPARVRSVVLRGRLVHP